MDKATAKEIKEIKKQLGAIARRLQQISSGGTVITHNNTHEFGGADVLNGVLRPSAIRLVGASRFYFKDNAGANIGSIDGDGELYLKKSVHENQSSV